MSEDTAYSTVPHDDEVMIAAADAEENGRPRSSTRPLRSGGGLICVMLCMVVLLIVILIWAVWAYLYLGDLNACMDSISDTEEHTRIHFSSLLR
jgi:hypothetical protein